MQQGKSERIVINIAFFINDITSSGGTERVTCTIANMLNETGKFHITVISLNEAYGTVKFPISPTIPTLRINKTPKSGIYRFPLVCARLVKLVKRWHIDILIDVDGILDLYSIPVKWFTGVKLISWEHFNFNQNPDVPYRKLSRQLAGIFADAIVTLTNQDRKNYEAGLRWTRTKLMTIPNPAELDSVQDHDMESKTILSAGRLTYQKGFDILVEVAKQVLPKHPEWKWVVFGEGEDRGLLENAVIRSGLEKQLFFPGRTSNLGQEFQKAAFVVMTSRFEGLPMVLLEAKTYRLPIISFDCETGPAEIIENNNNGLLVENFSISHMATNINSVIESSELREKFTIHALDGMDYYSMHSVRDKWLNLLTSLTARKGK